MTITIFKPMSITISKMMTITISKSMSITTILNHYQHLILPIRLP